MKVTRPDWFKEFTLKHPYNGDITFMGRLLVAMEKTPVSWVLSYVITRAPEFLHKERIEIYQTRKGNFISYRQIRSGSIGEWKIITLEQYMKVVRNPITVRYDPEVVK